MDSLKVATSAGPLLSKVTSMLKGEGMKTPLSGLVLGPNESSSAGSSSSNSPSTDKTDNHEAFGFYSDMRIEEERFKTFDKWPVSFLSPQVLAQNGFYYLGRHDEVRCAFCKVEIMQWVEGDDPAIDHQRWAPQCPLLRQGTAAGNVPSELDAGRDECGTRSPTTPSATRMPGPVNPQYASEAARLRTFHDWPRSMKQKPQELAEAGFFYTGHGDKTKCYYCDGGLKDWESDDVPWEQHARWFDRCAYVMLVKGRDYIQRVITEACVIRAEPQPGKDVEVSVAVQEKLATENAESGKEEEPVEDSKLCKICYSEERNVCFVPCGHVVACAKCALSTTKCPMCRRTFTNAVRLYFS